MNSTSPSHRISIYFSYILRPSLEWRALHSQECFLPPRGGFNLRCTRERYIPKNVFFLREEDLIYDAPSLPRKDSRFDQELPSIRGRKCGVKGLVQWRGLMVWSRSWFRTTGKGSRPVAWLDGMVEVLVSDNRETFLGM